MTACEHSNTMTVDFYRQNKAFGKVSKRKYYPPKKRAEVCINCKKILDKWKP